MITTVGTPLLWSLFLAAILLLLALDLGVFHRRAHAVGFREATLWSLVWILLSLAFNFWVYRHFGQRTGLEFLTGYLIEKALSVDNIFVFVVIFQYFAVPARFQHRVLFWGVIGAIVLRAIFILLGTALLARFQWLILVFGAFLLYTAIRLLLHAQAEVHPERNPVVRFFRRLVPITSDYEEHHFMVRRDRRLLATPLALVLVVVEATDVVFALDSIPAIFGITRDPFIVFTSNIMAVLGLRALYFVLHGVINKFRYLKVGLALVLAFIGAKMLLSEVLHVPIGISLAVVTALLSGSILLSLLRPGPPPEAEGAGKAP